MEIDVWPSSEERKIELLLICLMENKEHMREKSSGALLGMEARVNHENKIKCGPTGRMDDVAAIKPFWELFFGNCW